MPTMVTAVNACRMAEANDSAMPRCQVSFVGNQIRRDHRLAVTGAGAWKTP